MKPIKQRIRLKVQLIAGIGEYYKDKEITRTIDFLGSDNLQIMAIHILKHFDFDCDHAFGFCDDLDNPKESYSIFADMDDVDDFDSNDKSVINTLIEQVFTTKNKKMTMLFDYGDEWLFEINTLEIIPIDAKDRKRKPILVESIGTAPKQYPDYDDDE